MQGEDKKEKSYMDYFNESYGTGEEDKNFKQQLLKQKQQALKPFETAVQDLKSQISGIQAQRDAQQLALIGQGRGITQDLLNTQAAKIDRNAAIKLLPLTAQYQAELGRLESAEKNLTELYGAIVADRQAEREYTQAKFQFAYKVATDEQARSLKEREMATEERWRQEDRLDAIKKDLSDKFMEIGDYGNAGKVLDPNLTEAELTGFYTQMNSLSNIGQNIDVSNINSTAPSINKNISALTSLFQTNKVSTTNKTAIGNGLSLLTAANDLAKASTDGSISGIYPGRSVVDFFTPEFLKREKTVSNEALISALDLQTQFWASGAALTDRQTEQVMKMIPTKNDSDKAIKSKTNQLVNYMLSQTASKLITDGITFKPEPVDLFNVSLDEIVNMENIINQ
jgi:hypothetical protein